MRLLAIHPVGRLLLASMRVVKPGSSRTVSVPSAPKDMLAGQHWDLLMRDYPEYEAAVRAGSAAVDAEGDAFGAILRALPSASPASLAAVAAHACALTYEDEGDALEGASYAYRVLAAFAGRPVFGDDLPDEDESDDA